jgi:hypothetical protein
MRFVSVLVVAAGVALFAVGSASAVPANGRAISKAVDEVKAMTPVAGGCGVGWHRGPRGGCRP